MTAPYNPETLKLIRAGASARKLGWDDAFYRSVCRRHGIDPTASREPAPFEAPAIVPQQTAPTPAPSPAEPSPVEPTGNLVVIDIVGLEVRRGMASVGLTRKQITVVAVLARAAPHEFVSIDAIAPTIGVKPASVANYAAPLRAALRRIKVTVESTRGRGRGGYRLVDDLTLEPVRFKIIGRVKP